MSDKLQEIKLLAQNAMATGKGHVDLTTYALTWLIEQLEQARKKNHNMWECPDCGFAFDASHTDDGTDGQYSCPVCAEIELEKKLEQAQDMANRWQKAFQNADKQYLKKEKEAAELRRNLEQAQADKNELMDGLKDMHEQLEQCMGSHEKLEAACHRLKEDKRKLHAVHDENYAKAAHRAGVIEELQVANQKLVECLEWYAKDKTYNLQVTISMGSAHASHEPIKYDKGQRARQTLIEVKGNG